MKFAHRLVEFSRTAWSMLVLISCPVTGYMEVEIKSLHRFCIGRAPARIELLDTPCTSFEFE
jgi:hypothetical protein